MSQALRHCSKVARSLTIVRPSTPIGMTSEAQVLSNAPGRQPSLLQKQLHRHYASAVKPKETAKGKIDCACARHPWPEDKKEIKTKEKAKDCDFDFRKLEVNPYDIPCDCKDPPPAAGCADVGKPKEECCRSTRQYGCFCEEEEEESCEEEEEEEVGPKTCDLDFRKLEVNPYDDSCECHDPPPASSCETLAMKKDICCRTPRPFGCMCEAYDEPGLSCLKSKAPKQKKEKKECANKKKFDVKCL